MSSKDSAVEREILDDLGGYELPPEETWKDHVINYGKNLGKAAVRGVHALGETISGQDRFRGIENAVKGRPIEETFSEQLDEIIPTFSTENFAGRGLEKTLQALPSALSIPGGGPIKTALATLAGEETAEGIEELGGPEWAKTAARIAPFFTPELAKKLLSSGSNKEFIQEARKAGLSDKEITPLLQSNIKQNLLSWFARGRGRVQQRLKATQEALSKFRDSIATGEKATVPMSREASSSLLGDMNKVIEDMPSGLVDVFRADFENLAKNPVTGKSLMKFWADLNYYMLANPETAKRLSLLKDPISKGLRKIDGKMAADFDLFNRLYSKWGEINSKLKPTLSSDIVHGGEALAALGGLLTGNYGLLIGIGSHQLGKEIAKEMLTNPRYQNLASKMVQSLKKGSIQGARLTLEGFIKELGKTNKEASALLRQISDEDLQKFIDAEKDEGMQSNGL